ncbi:hypothetical protein KP509_05G004000 [Ceratopteris richardii]|uniref:MPN domain-containing protein n=1 Tax=Ceratopteris richardii TaxID=49495 RepID=A0A8T2UIZ4_CERRI|nr:hypothetical protein KP509_05G004000 [Ceratopteris richardii]
MRGPLQGRSGSSTISIAANTSKVEVDNRFPLSHYYRTAGNLFKQANVYREEKNIVELYVMLLRFCRLVGETIPEHRDYPIYSTKLKTEYRKRLGHAITELEKLKPIAVKEIESLNSSYTSTSVYESSGREHNENSRREHNEWPSVSNFEDSEASNGQVAGQGSRMVQSKQPYRLEDHLSSLSFNIPPPKSETLSRHSYFGHCGLQSPSTIPYLQAKVQYPSCIDASASNIPSLMQDSIEAPHVVEDSSLKAALDQLGALGRNIQDKQQAASQPRLINQPFPPPAVARVQTLTAPVLSYDHIPPPRVADPFPGLASSSNIANPKNKAEGPKKLYISTKMMDDFLRAVMDNTKKNLETCGVLAGLLRNASFYVTALIIPKQQSTSDSCQTVNEEEIFNWQDERNLFQLGWIHTHPKQSCFMSSIDLHTHYSYQVMLPEAIAIVMAPTDTTRTSGIFRLSDPGGIKTIQNCQRRGFHPHEQPLDGSSIYEHCSHVLMSSSLTYQVADLR